MTLKKTIQYYTNLANDRNHERQLAVSNNKTPSQGDVTIKCSKCNQTFTTKAHSYENARQSGCPNCKAIKARAQPKRVLSEKEQEDIKMRKKIKRAEKREARRILRNNYTFIKDGKMLKDF